MRKLGLVVKEASGTIIKDNLQNSSGVFVIKYSGLSSPDICALRQSLNDSRASLFVVRNTIARRVLKESGREELGKCVEGPCGFIFAKEEAVSISKLLCTFAKDHEKLVIEGGLMEEKVLTRNDIEALAKLPSKDVLRAKVVMGMKAPLSGLVMVLNGTLRKFVYCLEQIRQKKGN